MYFLLNSASIAETAAVISNEAKMFFDKGTTTLINGPANLLNNDSNELMILMILIRIYRLHR